RPARGVAGQCPRRPWQHGLTTGIIGGAGGGRRLYGAVGPGMGFAPPAFGPPGTRGSAFTTLRSASLCIPVAFAPKTRRGVDRAPGPATRKHLRKSSLPHNSETGADPDRVGKGARNLYRL